MKGSSTSLPSLQTCPYLDTITRTLLDFDFEHSCSVSLQSGPHIYGCLVCGKFFRGRGKHTPAYTHSVDEGHAVFVHLSQGTFHCLPDDYLIQDPSLSDISAALKPVFTEEEIALLDSQTSLARDLFGRRYLPGFVGLNNLKKTDYINATLQSLAHVKPLRDFFLRCGSGHTFQLKLRTSSVSSSSSFSSSKKRKRGAIKSKVKLITVDPLSFSHLAQCFGELIRKMWSNKRFKSTVDPHMLIQAVSVASKKKFTIGRQAEAGEFMSWILHQLHIGVGGTGKPGSSVIHSIFQGVVEITDRRSKRTERTLDVEEDYRIGSDDENERQKYEDRSKMDGNSPAEIEEVAMHTNFLQLTLDIPEKPLFKDDNGGLVIPQEPLVSVLKKFDGVSFNDILGASSTPQRRKYRLRKLPNYLILNLTRFKKNNFYNEKNPTIVAFPVKNLDLSRYVFPEEGKGEGVGLPSEADIRGMSVKELKTVMQHHGQSNLIENILEKPQLVETCINYLTKTLSELLEDKYNLVANITHNIPSEVGREGRFDPLEGGSYRCHVQHKAAGQWYEMQDLHVQDIMPQLIGLSESYVLIFERRGL